MTGWKSGAQNGSDKNFATARLTVRDLGDGRTELTTDVGYCDLAQGIEVYHELHSRLSCNP